MVGILGRAKDMRDGAWRVGWVGVGVGVGSREICLEGVFCMG